MPLPTIGRFPLWSLAFALVLSSCAAPMPQAPVEPQYAALPTVPAERPAAEAQPVVPTGDETLDAFLADLAAEIDRHDWRGVTLRFDPDAYAEQWALMSSEGRAPQAAAVQILAETLGASSLLGDYATLDAEPVARLDRLRVVTFREIQRISNGAIQVLGDARLRDGSRTPLDFSLERHGDRYHVIVPMG